MLRHHLALKANPHIPSDDNMTGPTHPCLCPNPRGRCQSALRRSIAATCQKKPPCADGPQPGLKSDCKKRQRGQAFGAEDSPCRMLSGLNGWAGWGRVGTGAVLGHSDSCDGPNMTLPSDGAGGGEGGGIKAIGVINQLRRDSPWNEVITCL